MNKYDLNGSNNSKKINFKENLSNDSKLGNIKNNQKNKFKKRFWTNLKDFYTIMKLLRE